MNRQRWDLFDVIPALAMVVLFGHIVTVAISYEDTPPARTAEEIAPSGSDNDRTADRQIAISTERL